MNRYRFTVTHKDKAPTVCFVEAETKNEACGIFWISVRHHNPKICLFTLLTNLKIRKMRAAK